MEHCVIRSSTRLLQYAALLYSISSYRCRGTVWAVPPDARGKIFDTKKNRYVVTEVSLNTVDENAIKDRILHAVWDLWTSHAEAIYRAMYGAFARAAADITPQIAAQLYAEQYPMLGYPTLENAHRRSHLLRGVGRVVPTCAVLQADRASVGLCHINAASAHRGGAKKIE